MNKLQLHSSASLKVKKKKCCAKKGKPKDIFHKIHSYEFKTQTKLNM